MESSSTNDEVLVRVQNVHKKFCRSLKKSLWYGLKDMAHELNPLSYREQFANGHSANARTERQLRDQEFWAVNDVSFELRRGECLGLIGHNGAGKTTLLKMLNGLIKPDRGSIEMRGRVGALIALGAGFNPILTGRENIHVNASVLGLTRDEVEDRMQNIVDFSEIEDFIDSPVQSYSSGMRVRLGFAVAMHLSPDVVLIDEVLAVGDIGFKIKCYNAINDMLQDSGIILVSHSMPQIGKVCTRGIVMDFGRVDKMSSNVGEIIATYYSKFGHQELSYAGNGLATLREIKFFQKPRTQSTELPGGNSIDFGLVEPDLPFEMEVRFDLDRKVEAFSVLVSVTGTDQKLVAQSYSGLISRRPPPTQQVRCCWSSLLLNSGSYTISMEIMNGFSEGWTEVIAGVRNIGCFKVQRKVFYGSAPLLYDTTWQRE